MAIAILATCIIILKLPFHRHLHRCLCVRAHRHTHTTHHGIMLQNIYTAYIAGKGHLNAYLPTQLCGQLLQLEQEQLQPQLEVVPTGANQVSHVQQSRSLVSSFSFSSLVCLYQWAVALFLQPGSNTLLLDTWGQNTCLEHVAEALHYITWCT